MVINTQIKWQLVFNSSPNLKSHLKGQSEVLERVLEILEVAPETKHEIY